MGLLDDAIREHLELKRLRGADPGLVSREESEVFGPIRGQEQAGDEGDPAAQQPPAHEDAPPAESDRAQPAGFSGQETAEIDMRTVLEGKPGTDPAPAEPIAPAPVAARPRSDNPLGERAAGEDSLEWEMPGEDAGERSSEDGPAADEQQDEPVEDVLEETPDFLLDTPEQERLWFEQRPPRDFDFDK
ncbi:MAG TPA: hypothetical protein VGH60_07725 [Solirubrobacteraceae bacterium]|jgi:hypothetical protein